MLCEESTKDTEKKTIKVEPSRRGRKRIYLSNAERTRAYRDRQRLKKQNLEDMLSKRKSLKPHGGARNGAGRPSLHRTRDEILCLRRRQRYYRQMQNEVVSEASVYSSDDANWSDRVYHVDHTYAAASPTHKREVPVIPTPPQLYVVYGPFRLNDLQRNVPNAVLPPIINSQNENVPAVFSPVMSTQTENVYIKEEPLDECEEKLDPSQFLEFSQKDIKLEPNDDMEDKVSETTPASTNSSSIQISKDVDIKTLVKSEPELIINDF